MKVLNQQQIKHVSGGDNPNIPDELTPYDPITRHAENSTQTITVGGSSGRQYGVITFFRMK